MHLVVFLVKPIIEIQNRETPRLPRPESRTSGLERSPGAQPPLPLWPSLCQGVALRKGRRLLPTETEQAASLAGATLPAAAGNCLPPENFVPLSHNFPTSGTTLSLPGLSAQWDAALLIVFEDARPSVSL